MTLDQLRMFVAVAEREHVTAAAAELNLTQSAVSGALHALERRHGVTLFHRVGRRIELTQEGRVFLAEARMVLAAAASADKTLHDLRGLKRGAIHIHASQTTASYWLPERLAKFKVRYPDIAIHLTIGNTTQVADAVLSGSAEIGFVEDAVEHPKLVARAIHKDQLAIVVHPSHPWLGRRRLKAAQIYESSWVLRERGSGTRAVFEQALRRHDIDPGRLRVSLELPSNESVRAAVEAGAGATAISHAAVRTAVTARRLRIVPFQPMERSFLSLVHGERRQSFAAHAFAEISAETGSR